MSNDKKTNRSLLQSSLDAELDTPVNTKFTQQVSKYEMADKVLASPASPDIEKIEEVIHKAEGFRKTFYLRGETAEKLEQLDEKISELKLNITDSELIFLGFDYLCSLPNEELRDLFFNKFGNSITKRRKKKSY